MASPSGAPVLAERSDIHKACKSIETLLNILNEYCEAAGAVVTLQKKLSKALKDAASLKVTGEIASNALHASASVFESLSDADSKFAKIADKEYDLISAEVKKWFKKLAKEEKAHDERMANANAKIKQAGQVYEKKSKKKTTDVSEEHARYINLISTLGPEISQDKYNHALNVSQRHAATTFSVAACLARLADFEWQRSCECVRRFSPTVGPLGRWRSLCEGGWTGPIPPDLPDLDSANIPQTPQTERNEGLKPIEEDARPSQATTSAAVSARVTPEPQEIAQLAPPGYSTTSESLAETRENPSARNSPTLTRAQISSTNVSAMGEPAPAAPTLDILEPPKPQYVDNTGSVRSLSAFPSPPTHFPIPPARVQPQRQQSALAQSIKSSSNLEFPSTSQLAESPVSATGDLPTSSDAEDPSSRTGLKNPSHGQYSGPPSPEQRFREQPTILEEAEPPQIPTTIQKSDEYRPMPLRAQTSLPAESSYQNNRPMNGGHRSSSSTDIKPMNARLYRDEYRDGKEFGVLPSTTATSKSRTMDNYKYSKPIERMDTGTSNVSGNGSIVAAMRNRYSSTSGSTSPTPRDLPRLPLSVNDIASRYQPTDVPLSPRVRSSSPPVARQQSLPLLETAARQAQESYHQGLHSPDEERRRRQQEVAEMQRRQKEQELRDREHELEMRARELERDRLRLQDLRETDQDQGRRESFDREGSSSNAQNGQFGVRPRERRISLRHQMQRPQSQLDIDEVDERSYGSPAPSDPQYRQRPQSSQQESYTSTHLALPSGGNMPPALHSPKPSHPPSPLLRSEELQHESSSSNRYRESSSNSNTNSTSTFTHAPNCGCQSCSISKYKEINRQPVEPKSPGQRSEKSSKIGSGWIRRLSMPVGNAFSLDTKKHQSNNSVSGMNHSNYGHGAGISGGQATSGKGLFSLDGKKNNSTTALLPGSGGGLSPHEDGRLGRPAGGAVGRRSYEASGVSNRSMTNLGLSGRH